MSSLTEAQIQRTLDIALTWKRGGDALSARIRLCELRRRVTREQRDALDAQLKKHRFLREVLETEAARREGKPRERHGIRTLAMTEAD